MLDEAALAAATQLARVPAPRTRGVVGVRGDSRRRVRHPLTTPRSPKVGGETFGSAVDVDSPAALRDLVGHTSYARPRTVFTWSPDG